MNRIWRAFIYSLQGITSAWRDEPAFRQEAVLAAILIPVACVYAPNTLSLIAMVGSVLLVMALELINTAVEAAINRISHDIHPLSKKAKDTASAAVFLGLLNAGFVWIAVLCF